MKKLLLATVIFAAMLKPAAAQTPKDNVFVVENGRRYWYENGIRQGVKGDPKNIIDTIYKVERGREIYDPASDAWYWLDASEGGAVACSKEVWMPYIYQNEPKGSSQGKWVRYNSQGRMVKGWYANSKGVYFYDLETGEMYKGLHTIRGITYYFDPVTGVRRSSQKNQNALQ